jgi:hypothetical protein
MASLVGKMVSWAAREAEELASKSGMSLERAAEEVADKYGQRAFSATAKPAVDEFATSAPSMFLGDANAPRNKSLRELVSPGVEESITAREASRYTEPGPLNRPVSRAGESTMLGVQESTIARDASKYREPGVAGQKQLQNLQESTVARDASKYNEPDIPQYSKPIGPEFNRGTDVDYKQPSGGNLKAALTAGAAGGTALGAGMFLKDNEKDTGTNQPSSEYEDKLKQKWRDSWTRSQVPFTEEDVERKWKATVVSKPSAKELQESRAQQAESGPQRREEELERLRERQRMAGLPESQLSTALRRATPEELAAEQEARSFRTAQATAQPEAEPEKSKPITTTEAKKEAKKAVTATDDRAKEAQKAADKGEIPQVEADRFKEERDRAYKMYSEAKDRNEWLELAQLLGQAVTQYGAAQVGMRTGRSMAGLQLPSVDYGARTTQEQRLLESRLRDIGEEQTREQRLADRLKEDKRDEDRLALEKRRVELAEREARKPTTDLTEARQIREEQRKKQDQRQAAITNIMAGLATLKVGDSKQRKDASELIDKNLAAAGLPGGAINKISELKEGPGFFSGSWDKKRQEVESLLQSETPPATIPSQPSPSLSTEDQQALEWATQNPSDPRAAEIRKRLGR